MGSNKVKSAIVVGAGLAGLSAAYRLKQAGWQVKVLELNNYPGGRAASVSKQGYLIDTGATGVGECYTDYLQLVEELGLSDKIVPASSIVGTLREGKIYEMDGSKPLRSGFFSRLFSWRSKLLMPRMFADLKAMGDTMHFQDLSRAYEWDDESAKDYALHRLNKEIYQYFVDPVLRALVVMRAEYVSRLEVMNAINGLFGGRVVSPLGGIGLLPKILSEQVNVHYNTETISVADEANGVAVRSINKDGVESLERADACVIATLLPQAVNLYKKCQPWVEPLNEGLHYVPGLCVHLGFKKATISKALMVLLSAEEVPEVTLFWLDHNKAVDRAPEGHSLFYLYYDDAVTDAVCQWTDEELITHSRNLIEKHFPEVKGEMDMSLVSRWAAAVPAPVTGYYKRMKKTKEKLDVNLQRVQLAGDYLSCVGQNTAVYYGSEAARKLMELHE